MKKNKKFKLGFLGIGRMAEILLRAMLKSKAIKASEVLVSRNSQSALKKIARELKVHTTQDNCEIAQQCEQIWLGIKPFQAGKVLSEIKPYLTKDQTLVSMMAGISLNFLKSLSGGKAALVRMMPNTPCLIGEGLIGIYFPPKTKIQTRKLLLTLLNQAGKISVCKRETDLDAITGLSGSGVAFVYHLAQGLIEGGIESGLSAKQASEIALQTLFGASRMLEESQSSPESLVAQVVSKGGTTEAGLRVLNQGAGKDWLAKAVVEATRRAGEIREENNRCIS